MTSTLEAGATGGFLAVEQTAAELEREKLMQAFAFVVPDTELERVARMLTNIPAADLPTWFAWFAQTWLQGYGSGHDDAKAGKDMRGEHEAEAT